MKSMEIGEERGIAKNNLLTAKRLKEAGIAIETIMLATNLSIHQIGEYEVISLKQSIKIQNMF
jgi:predicted transposase YdaD